MVRTTIKKKGKGKDEEPIAASKDDSRDILSRTGGTGAGSEFVDAASRFMASYGRVIVPVIFLVIFGIFGLWLLERNSQSSDMEARNSIDAAVATGIEDKDLAKLQTEMEEVLVDYEGEDEVLAYGHYRWSLAAYGLLEAPYEVEDVTTVIKIMKEFEGLVDDKEGESSRMLSRVAKLRKRLVADKEFLESELAKESGKRTMPWTHNTKFSRPAAKLTANGEDPIIVFVTSVGVLRFGMYETDAGNAVKHFVSLCEEGFYDRTDFTAESYSNNFSPIGIFRDATVIAAGKEGRPAGVELKKPDTAEDGDDVDLVTEENPFTIEYQGASVKVKKFAPGTIALIHDPDEPTRARTEFFVVIEPSKTLANNFQPLGYLLDPEKSMGIARRLHQAEIYYTYVEQKRKGVEYKPEVFYDDWPVPTIKRDKVPDPISFMGLETEILPAGSKLNPIVVLETEKGDILIELHQDRAPNTVANFINMIEEGFFNDECEFYKVEGTGSELRDIYKGRGPRIIQGGFDQSESRADYDYTIRNEAVDSDKYKGKNIRGTIAMDHMPGNVHSASSEFFINLKNHPDKDKKGSPYCVFGHVIYGLDIAAQIQKEDAIKGAKVLRKRDDKYIPDVKYKAGGGTIKKKAVKLEIKKDDEEK